ncbi:GMC family oxidoreductase [Streptomyces sp. NPDC048551]|uniref:GMC family oxidoreductase n=1 Tax=Streptomyces sp. NPDC048551 TaxID=3155758 RepID=UPI00342081F1
MTGPDRYDVIVVGAGIAGSLVARHLGGLGRHVLVLEAGVRADGAPHTAQDAAPWPEVTDVSGTEGGYRADGYFVQRGELPYASGYVRVNGGTGNVWTGLTPRMLPEDFDTELFGYGRSWPMGYADLEPYYRAAEQAIGVSADVDEQRAGVGLPFPEDYVFPMRALPRSRVDEVLAGRLDGRRITEPGVAEPVELRVVGTPQGRNGVPDPRYGGGAGYVPLGAGGRPAPDSRCVGSATCIPHCPSHAKYTPLKTQAGWGPTVVLRDRAVVSRVLAGPGGRATGVEYLAYAGDGAAGGTGPGAVTGHTVHADVVVLAAHAIENAKLLLMSGLANRSGQVGRNLMDHPVLLTWGLLPEQVGPYRGPGSTSGLEGFRAGPARRLRAPFRIEIGNWGWVWAKGPVDTDVTELVRGAGPGRPGLRGAALRAALADRIGRQFTLQFEMEQSADPANRVTIDPRLRDRLGLPRPVLTYGLSEHVKDGIAAARAVSDRIFALLGAEDHTSFGAAGWPGRFEHRGRTYGYRGAGHAAGTHVMGSGPDTSVVDTWQRCWDHTGLYAVGCGSMPSVATSNPTLTMAALALRSAGRIEAELTARDRPVTLTSTREPLRSGERGPVRTVRSSGAPS